MSKSGISTFEDNVLRVVLLLGLLRVIIELLTNQQDGSQTDLTLDIAFFCVFSLGLILIFLKTNPTYLLIGFYIPLVLLLPLSFFEVNGIAYSDETNIYGGILILCLTLKGKAPAKLVGLLLFFTVLAILGVHFSYPEITDTSTFSDNKFNFVFMALGAVIVIFYAKSVFDKRSIMLQRTQERLHDLNKSIEQKTIRIEKQNQELHELNGFLENEVRDQIGKLDRQKEAMNQYVQIILDELVESHLQVKNTILKSIGNAEIDKMIIDSSSRLDSEVELLKQKINNA